MSVELYTKDTMDPILDAVRDKLAKNFGVTRIEHRIVLRTDVDGVNTEIELVVNTIRQDLPACDSCQQAFAFGDTIHEAIIKTSVHDAHGRGKPPVGPVVERKVKLCEDCYSPK